MYFGVCVTILVTASWVAATHCIKFLYLKPSTYASIGADLDDYLDSTSSRSAELELATTFNKNEHILEIKDNSADAVTEVEEDTKIFRIPLHNPKEPTTFSAPFFAAWFFTNFSFLFFPIYVVGRVSLRKCDKPSEILGDVLRGFRDRGFTIGNMLYKIYKKN